MTASKTSDKTEQGASSNEKEASTSGTKKNTISDEEVRQESSKAANAAIAAQKKAKELRDAAAGAGDPDVRQKLTEEAINKEIEAESFGKTAKYLNSGTFQGLAIGTGLGVAPGAGLGALTGTLVGGVTSTITGGLGGGIGAAAGRIHGPMWNLGEMAGKGVRKATGDLPGWVASDEQKQALEKMVGQIKEEDMPDESELQTLGKQGGAAMPDEGWMKSAQNMMPSMKSEEKSPAKQEDSNSKKQGSESSDTHKGEQPGTEASEQKKDTANCKKPRKLDAKSNSNSNTEPGKQAAGKKQPRKLENRSNKGNEKPAETTETKAHPRKLEKRDS
jgi:hypothetical protein